jgi:hypothetical protein
MTTILFKELAVGDLFLVDEEEYRRIPPIIIPDAGERNAARQKDQAWRYFPPATVVTFVKKTNYPVDQARTERAQEDHK